jgi:hypothetical protein
VHVRLPVSKCSGVLDDVERQASVQQPHGHAKCPDQDQRPSPDPYTVDDDPEIVLTIFAAVEFHPGLHHESLGI